ncbi:hypothetical protein ITI46_12745 [Streptomyces oryzae]|uniref:Aromatic ring-opening dioxygenase LigA n=1 Tax=Streptomyces oryzae TaxID=1434886 RepID=A0ABS3XB07_9ACTN|nr:DUF5954 family protein [Streptomyces oryzae]MBO8192526.1 hypothetical protein [Streptomyces oryzae]
MRDHHKQYSSPDHLTIRVAHRDDPVSQVTELDAFRSGQRYPDIVVRGPLFGCAVQTPGDRPRWRLLGELDAGYPQDARDELNSYLWYYAKDRAGDHRERRRLLDGVARLEKKRIDELTVGRDRYRVVRADEFARIGDGALEPPRATDHPEDDHWDLEKKNPPSDAEGFVVDHAAEVQLTNGLERLALRENVYRSERFPADVLADSRRALHTHPGLVLLPPAFRVLEREPESWSMFLAKQFPTPQAARRGLVHHLTRSVPMVREIPGLESEYSERDVEVFAKAAERFMRQRGANELRARGRTFHIVRVERMMRIGPDGPEPPRPSDQDHQEPTKIHPTMDEWGNLSYDD